MTRDTYLSIDLDFWNSTDHITDSSIRSFFKRLPSVPTVLVEYHHELLPHINEERLACLRNVDFHSDLGGFEGLSISEQRHYRRLPKLSEGTWVDHVAWCKDAEFVWHCPNLDDCFWKCDGRCDAPSLRDLSLHDVRRCGVFGDPTLHGWKKVHVRGSLRGIDMDRVARVGVSLSLDWLSGYHSRAVLPFLYTVNGALAQQLDDFLCVGVFSGQTRLS